MKKYIENFYYGLLIAGFIYFMEYWQEGKVGILMTIWIMIIPFFCSGFLNDLFFKIMTSNDKKKK